MEYEARGVFESFTYSSLRWRFIVTYTKATCHGLWSGNWNNSEFAHPYMYIHKHDMIHRNLSILVWEHGVEKCFGGSGQFGAASKIHGVHF